MVNALKAFAFASAAFGVAKAAVPVYGKSLHSTYEKRDADAGANLALAKKSKTKTRSASKKAKRQCPAPVPPVETPPIEEPVPEPVPEPTPEPPVEEPVPEPVPEPAPPVEVPPVEAPPVEAPPVEAPPVEAPPVEAPPVEAPPVEAPPPVEVPPPAPAGKYNTIDTFIGDGFYNGFNFITIDDPTHGRVDYVDQATAQAMNLTSSTGDSFVMRADQGPTDPASRGRKAVRLESKNLYDVHVTVADIRHMPEGQVTWPAFWEYGADWPNNGEIDLLEGANDVGPNKITLHTTNGCIQPLGGRDMTGAAVTDNCDSFAPGNIGCGVNAPFPESYGPAFNAAGGGYIALERANDLIRVWQWGRNDPAVPQEVRDNVPGVNPDSWGRPTAVFTSEQCPINDKFNGNMITINLTFCGDWAGTTFPGGMGPCNDLVNAGGDWTSRAFWDIARISVYA